MMNKKQPKFGISDGIHVGLGVISGFILRKKPIESTTASALYVSYQGLSFARKGKTDRVGFDVKTYAIGWAAGVIACEVLDWLQEDSK